MINFLAYSFAEIRKFVIKLALGKLLIFSWILKTAFWTNHQLINIFWFSIKLDSINFQFVLYLWKNMIDNDKCEFLLLSYWNPLFSEFFLRLFTFYIIWKTEKLHSDRVWFFLSEKWYFCMRINNFYLKHTFFLT